MKRREFLQWAALGVAGAAVNCQHRALSAEGKKPRLLFTTNGKTCMVNADGTGLRTFAFDVPNQATWQPTGFLSDGRMLFLSMEPRRDGPGKPFGEYYHKTPTHLWVHDIDRGTLTEVATKERMAPFYTPQLLLNDQRILMQVVGDKGGQIYSMNLDGTDARAFTQAGEGMPYGLSLSPDGGRVAFHLASPQGYQIWTSDVDGANRRRVAAAPDHLYFGTSWSPDGEWVLYQDCLYKSDPGHDWSDVCIGRPDGSECRALTHGGAVWFAASYGNARKHGNGSNMPDWTRGGEVICACRLPGTKVPWEYKTDCADVDHFNRAFKPESAHGGTEVCRINPRDGSVTRLTKSEPPVWDFRGCESPDGGLVAFCRCATGELPALWVMNANGGEQRLIARGLGDDGADQPRWIPLKET